MRLTLALALIAGPCFADNDPLALFEHNGCVLSAGDVATAQDGGVDVTALDAYITAQLATGHIVEQGAYTVLAQDVCTIRLPRITTDWPLDAPEIVAITGAIDEDPNAPGCFLQDPAGFFERSYPDDPARAYAEFTSFLAAHLIAGDVRFFSASPLETPAAWQVVSGACARVPEIDAIRATHRYIADAPFAEAVRLLQANDACFQERSDSLNLAAMVVQGVDPVTGEARGDGPVNAWLSIEYLMIALAADWVIGDSLTERGMTRPPLCGWP